MWVEMVVLGGIVAYLVECTNVVKKWYGSDCDNQGYQGRRGWFFKPRLLFVCLFIGTRPDKLYTTSCWEGSKPPGSGHTRSEAQNRDVYTKDTLKFKRDIQHVIPSVNVITFSEREEESADFKNMYSPISPPPLIDTDKCGLTLLPRVTRARAGCIPCV